MDQFRSHPLYRKHNLDSVMSSMWEFYKRYFLSLFAISVVISVITQLAYNYMGIREMQAMTDPEAMIEKMKEFVVPGMVIVLVSLFFNTVLQHYILFRPVNDNNGILKSVFKAFRYYLPFVVMMIMFAFIGAIGIMVGVLALVIGVFFVALYLLMIYLFILPVMMVEGPDIGNTISRTLRLAHRNFWSNMGWVAIFLIIMIVVSVILSSIIMLPFAGSALKSIFNPGEAATSGFYDSPVFMILSALTGALTMPLLPILSCILYFNVRAEEDEKEIIHKQPEEYRPTIDDLYARPRDEEGNQ